MARALKPGGQLCLITSPPEFEEKIARFSHAMTDSMRFDAPSTLEDWARQARLQPLETRQAANAGFLIMAAKEMPQ
jgi:hypothetical protein